MDFVIGIIYNNLVNLLLSYQDAIIIKVKTVCSSLRLCEKYTFLKDIHFATGIDQFEQRTQLTQIIRLDYSFEILIFLKLNS